MAPDPSSPRPPWALLAASAVLVPTVLAGLTLAWPRPQIETSLTASAQQALSVAGISGGTVTFSGRDATLGGVPAAQRMQAIQAVEAATGVRVARVLEPGPGGPAPGPGGPVPEPGSASSASAQTFGVARQGGSIVLTGTVTSADEKAALIAAVTAEAGGRAVVDQLTVTPDVPQTTGVGAAAVGGVTAALAAAPGDLSAVFGPDGVTLTGTVPDEAAKAAAAAAITAAVPGTVNNKITVGGSSGAVAGDLDAAAKQALQAELAALVATAPISFGPDSPQLTPQGRATLSKVVAAVVATPGARLRIDGYVATGRGNGRLTAQQLSDQRAQVVRDALVAGGVPADHLTASGRGEAPAADKALGRRAEITVV